MSKLTSNIARIINETREFSRTPAGQVAKSGISYMAGLAISGGIMVTLPPETMPLKS